MARSHFLAVTLVTVTLLAADLQVGRADSPKWRPTNLPTSPTSRANAQADTNGSTCIIYPLSDLGDDPNLCKWIAETIPEVIQPGTWNQAAGTEQRRRISYFAPSKVLVIYHTPTVHAKVDAFLKDVKKALPQEKATASTTRALTKDRGLIPAQFTEPQAIRAAEPAAAAKSSYPVPAPLQQPKHLFHFIIRYEGDGIVDSNVAGLVKELSGTKASKDEESSEKANTEAAKSPQLSQLLHFILRYEGEGIIDSNVVALLKGMYGQSAAKETGTAYPASTPTYPPQPSSSPEQPESEAAPPPPPSDYPH